MWCSICCGAGWREGSACSVVSAGAALQQAAHIPADSRELHTTFHWGGQLDAGICSESTGRGLVCTRVNAVVVLGIAKRYLSIIKTRDKGSI